MKRAVSPLVATVILLLSAIIIGTVVMNWGMDYIEELTKIKPAATSPVSPIGIGSICTEDPLLILQTRYARGEITTAKYLEMKALITNTPLNSS